MAVIKASETFKPNVIADYLFELAKKFNSFTIVVQYLIRKMRFILKKLLAKSSWRYYKRWIGFTWN